MSPSVDDKAPTAACESARPLAKAADLTSLRLCHRVILLTGCFLVAYVYGLDYTLRATYQSTATASFGGHSLLATINVARFAMAAAAQPLFARGSDRFGRLELCVASLVLYVVGSVIQACALNVGTFAAGAVIYQLGYTGLQLMVEVLVADTTSLKSRLFFTFIPVSPFLINTWVSGTIAQSVLDHAGWKWGFGIGAIVMPAASSPLIAILFYTRHERAALLAGDQEYPAAAPPARSRWVKIVDFAWEMDLVGLFLLLAACALVLLPLTLAGGLQKEWRRPYIIVMLVVGVLCIPLFFFWETRVAQFPLVRKEHLRDRSILGSLGVAIFLNAWWLQGNYLYTVCYVSFGQSIATSTRISNLYSFVACISGIGAGILVRKIRRMRHMMFFGVAVFAVGFGLVVRYRGGPTQFAGMVGGQVVLGIAGGFFTYPGQVAIQAAVEHRYLAVATSLYLASYYVGSAVFEALAGAIWTQTLPAMLLSELGNATLADAVYASPFTFAEQYPIGTVERSAVIAAYRHTQLLLTVTALALCVPLCASVALIRDVKLGEEQSLKVEPGVEKK